MTWRNALLGVAYGDAWGAPHEFASYEQITTPHEQGPQFPTDAQVTDDTQMALALADALHDTDGWSEEFVFDAIVNAFVGYYNDEDNTAERAPGGTVMSSLSKIDAGHAWYAATDLRSKGCGTVMRTAAVMNLDESVWRRVAAFQSLVTHANPTATVASVLTTAVLRQAQTTGQGNLLNLALDLANDPSLTDGLDDLVAPVLDLHGLPGDSYFTDGLTEVRAAMVKAKTALDDTFRSDPWAGDICDAAGQGWIAEETVAVALLAADALPDDPTQALRRAVMTGGDSDSIGAVAGSFIGAANGSDTKLWPSWWNGALEVRYAAWIDDASTYWP